MYEILQRGTSNYTEIIRIDNVGPGNAHHKYQVREVVTQEQAELPGLPAVFANIKFQKGPVKETGINGLHNKDLLNIVIDRLEGFQNGDFACEENYQALK